MTHTFRLVSAPATGAHAMPFQSFTWKPTVRSLLANGVRHPPHAPERRHIGPARIALVGIVIPPGQRRRPLEIRRCDREGKKLEEEILRIRGRNVPPRLPVVVEERHVL